jgi:hypothetical protein
MNRYDCLPLACAARGGGGGSRARDAGACSPTALECRGANGFIQIHLCIGNYKKT